MTGSIDDRDASVGNGPGDREWWARWKAAVGIDLMGGYGTLVRNRDPNQGEAT